MQTNSSPTRLTVYCNLHRKCCLKCQADLDAYRHVWSNATLENSSKDLNYKMSRKRKFLEEQHAS